MAEWACPALSFFSFARNLWPSNLLSGLPSPCQKSLEKVLVSVICGFKSLVFLTESLCFSLFYPCAVKASPLKGTVSCSPRQRNLALCCSVAVGAGLRGGNKSEVLARCAHVFLPVLVQDPHQTSGARLARCELITQSPRIFLSRFLDKDLYVFYPDCTQSIKFLMYWIN